MENAMKGDAGWQILGNGFTLSFLGERKKAASDELHSVNRTEEFRY